MRRAGFPSLRFTLRTLCGLVLLVGLLSGASAWYVQHYLRPRQEHDRVVNLVEKWGGQCISTRQSPSEQNLIDRVLGLEPSERVDTVVLHGLVIAQSERIDAQKRRRWKEVTAFTIETDERALAVLREMVVGDDEIRMLSAIREVRVLELSFTRVTDDGLKPLASLENLEVLRLSYTSITGEGLRHLRELPRLKVLTLNGVVLTPAGAREVANLKALEELDINSKPVSLSVLDELTRSKSIRRLHVAVRSALPLSEQKQYIAKLAQMPRLEFLDESGFFGVSIEELRRLKPGIVMSYDRSKP